MTKETANDRPDPSCRVPGIPHEPVFHGDYSFNTGVVKGLKAVDFFIFVATLVISMSIGFYVTWVNRKKLSINEYVLAGRSMGLLPVSVSLFASFISSVSLLGIPAEVFSFSAMYLWTAPCYIVVSALTAELFMPVFYQLQLSSVHQYLEMRFSRKVRSLASFLFITIMIIYMSIILMIPSIAIHQVTGIDTGVAAFSVGLVCVIYTSIGGMKAVIWTDFFQMGVFFGGLMSLLVWSQVNVMPIGDVFTWAYKANRLNIADFRLDITLRHNVWATVVGGIGLWAGFYACGQAFIHRCLTCKTLETAKRAVWYNCVMMVLNIFLLILLGLYMGAFYHHCNPVTANIIQKTNEIFPLYVMDTTSYGMPGIFFAIVISATLSSVSSAMSSLSTAVLEDFIRPFSNTHIHDERARSLSRVTCFVAGFVCFDLIYLMLSTNDILKLATYVNLAFSSPVLGVFSLGLFFPWVNANGGFCGLLTSTMFNCMVMAMRMISPSPPPHSAMACVSNCNASSFFNVTEYVMKNVMATPPPVDRSEMNILTRMAFQWICLIASTICITVGLVVSWLTGNLDTKDVDPRLIVPVTDILFPFYYLPEKFRVKLRFGISHSGKWTAPTSRRTEAMQEIKGQSSVDRLGSLQLKTNIQQPDTDDLNNPFHSSV